MSSISSSGDDGNSSNSAEPSSKETPTPRNVVRGGNPNRPARSSPLISSYANEPSSYPFPVIPTPNDGPSQSTIPSSLSLPTTPAYDSHTFQPFTSLSPTAPPIPSPPRRYMGSFGIDGEEKEHIQHDPDNRGHDVPNKLDFPSLLLRIQSGTNLSGFWQQLASVLAENFAACRATLSIPGDETDLENVPWRQLATWIPKPKLEDQRIPAVTSDDARSSLNPFSLKQGPPKRPQLVTRNTVAGYYPRSQVEDSPAETTTQFRPILSHRSSMTRPGLSRAQSSTIDKISRPYSNIGASSRHDTLTTDLSNSSTGSAEIFYPSRKLEDELDPLILSAGISRILRKGGPQRLIREYHSSRSPADEDSLQPSKEGGSVRSTRSRRPWPVPYQPQHSFHSEHSTSTVTKLNLRTTSRISFAPSLGSFESSNSDEAQGVPGTEFIRTRLYDDYERIERSPLPSSSLTDDQKDKDSYFSPNQIDEARRQSDTPDHGTPVAEADKNVSDPSNERQTVLQIPLFRPTTGNDGSSSGFKSDFGLTPWSSQHNVLRTVSMMSKRTITSSGEREMNRAKPVAILSVLSSKVPYPDGLFDSLVQLVPFIATTFCNLLQIHELSKRATNLSLRVEQLEAESKSVRRPALRSNVSSLGGKNLERPGIRRSKTVAGSETGRPGLRLADDRLSGGFNMPGSRLDRIEQSPPNPSDGGSPVAARAPPRVSALRVPDSSEDDDNLSVASSITNDPRDDASDAGDSVTSLPVSDALGRAQLLQMSAKMLIEMIDNGASQQWIIDSKTGDLTWSNAKFNNYRGSRDSKSLTTFFWERVYSKDRKKLQAEWSEALASGKQTSRSVRLKRFDGAYRWFHVRIIPMPNKHDGINFWQGQAMDIHEQHEAESSAAKSKEQTKSAQKYRALANSLPVMVLACSVSEGVTFVNSQWATFTGQSIKDAMHQGFLKHVCEEDIDKISFLQNDTAPDSPGTTTGGALLHETHVTSPDKNPLLRKDSSSSSLGESEYSATTEKPIEDRKVGLRTEKSIEDAAINAMDLPNDYFREMVRSGKLNCSRDGLGNIVVTTDLRLKSASGEYKWHFIQATFLKGVNFGGGEAQWTIACTDISKRMEQEARMLEINAALEQEMITKMDYLSSLSHEIRTPLNGIVGNLQFLNTADLDELATEWVLGSMAAARGMQELIDNILDLSKAEANMLTLSEHLFSIRQICEDILDLINPRAVEKHLELAAEVSPDVPMELLGDSGRIRQVLINLVTNAVKFTKTGEVWTSCSLATDVPPEIKSQASDSQVFVKFAVHDTGRGFAPEEKQFLFKRYSQIKKKDTRETGGTGLGLVLCKTMVELHGGQIDAQSVQGQGSVFTFFARFGLSEAELAKRNKRSAASPPPLSKSRSAPTVKQIVEASQKRRKSGFDLAQGKSEAAQARDSSNLAALTPSTTLEDSSSISREDSGETSAGDPEIFSLKHGSERSSVSTTDDDSSGTDGSRLSRMTSPTSAPSQRSSRSSNQKPAQQDSKTTRTVSILLFCRQPNAQRITGKRIASILPPTVKLSVDGEADPATALTKLKTRASDYTHVVIRTPEIDDVKPFLEELFKSRKDSTDKPTLVLITDQAQLRDVQEIVGEETLDKFARSGRFKSIHKPPHPYKLAPVFDPFNESSVEVENPVHRQKEEVVLRKKRFEEFKEEFVKRKVKVLLVDDDASSIKIPEQFFVKFCDVPVTKASNGQEALDMVVAKPPGTWSLIITDLKMPVLDGPGMCTAIRKWETENKYTHMPIVSLSAFNEREAWQISAPAGFTATATKPLNMTALGNLVMDLTTPGKAHVFMKDTKQKEK